MPRDRIKESISHTLKSELNGVLAIKSILPEIRKAVSLIHKRQGHILVVGIGKSAAIGAKVAATLTSLGNPSIFIHPVDALHGDTGIAHDNDVVLALSYSGESEEVVRAAQYLKKEFGLPLISITGYKSSSLGRLSDLVLEVSIKEEGSINSFAPMASTTATLVIGDLIACGLAEKRGFRDKHFARFHPGGSLGLRLRQVTELGVSGKKIPLVRETGTLKEAIATLDKGKKGIVGITSKSQALTGVLTDGDVRRYFLKHESAKGVQVSEVMTRLPRTIVSSASVSEALSLMREAKITALFIVEKTGVLIGLIHMHDIVERI